MQREREVSERDDGPADQNGPGGAEPSIGDEAARNGQHIHGHRVVAVDHGRFGDRKPKAAVRRRGHHEQHEQGPHSVIGEAFPEFREEQRAQAAGMGPARGIGTHVTTQ